MKKIIIFLSAHIFCIHLLAMQRAEIPYKKQSTISKIKCTWPHCTAYYSNDALLSAHIQAHEKCEGKIYQCNTGECKQYFYKNEHLKSHYREYHPTMVLAVAKKIKKCGGANKRVKTSKKRKSRAQEIKTSPSLPQPPAKPEPKMLTPPSPFKAPLHPATQALLICLERRNPLHEPGKEAILYKVPFKIQNNEMVKTTGLPIMHLVECSIEGCKEKFATTHGRMHHLIHIHKHEFFTRTFKS